MKLWSQNIKTKNLAKKVSFSKNQSAFSHTPLKLSVPQWSSPFFQRLYKRKQSYVLFKFKWWQKLCDLASDF
jgi:hypothetical protein